MLILDLWVISFHPVVVIGLGNDLLFNFLLGHCDISTLLCIFQHLPKGINASILFLMVCNTYVIYTNVWKEKYSSIYFTSFYVYDVYVLLLRKLIVFQYQSNRRKVRKKRIILREHT